MKTPSTYTQSSGLVPRRGNISLPDWEKVGSRRFRNGWYKDRRGIVIINQWEGVQGTQITMLRLVDTSSGVEHERKWFDQPEIAGCTRRARQFLTDIMGSIA